MVRFFREKKAPQVTDNAARCIISFLAVAPEKTAVSAQFKFLAKHHTVKQ
jgi:hypothetical protein